MYADDAGDKAGRIITEEIEERLWMACLVTATDNNSLGRWSLGLDFTWHCVVGMNITDYRSHWIELAKVRHLSCRILQY